MKILHIISDQKFIDTGIMRFERAAPGDNVYLLPTLQPKTELKYIETSKPIVSCNVLSVRSKKLINWIASFDMIVLHSLTPFAIEVVNKIKNKTKIVWIGWGYDYYDMIFENELDLYEPLTRNIIGKEACKKFNLTNRFKSLVRKIVYPTNKRKVLNYINYFAPVLECEYAMVKESLSSFHPEYVDWNYGSANSLNPNISSVKEVKKNILIGNSASPNNNHLDVFNLIKDSFIPKEAKVIVPLSYGGSKKYVSQVISEGKRLFGDSFLPVLSFMPYQEYINIISDCNIVIMCQKRQQGTGNIGAALLTGAKVFMSVENAYYSTSIKRGMKIFCINKLCQHGLVDGLHINERINNYRKMKDILDEDFFTSRTKKIIDLI